MNVSSLKRAAFLARAGAVSAAGASWVRFPADAAEFEYRSATSSPLADPLFIHMGRTWETVRAKTNGRLQITAFGNQSLGSDAAIMTQLRSGAIQFITASGGALSLAGVSIAAIESLGFAFETPEQFLKTMDGPLGGLVRKQAAANGLLVYPRTWDIGPRAIATNPHPISGPEDFRGLKLRILAAKISFELFASLGATPVNVELSEVYTGMQTHLIDGVELAIGIMYFVKTYEVAKYLSLSNHLCSSQWLVSNPTAIQALPADVRKILADAIEDGVAAERAAYVAQNKTIVDNFRSKGIAVSANIDRERIRARLRPYYARWHTTFGDAAWSLLEASVGKLG